MTAVGEEDIEQRLVSSGADPSMRTVPSMHHYRTRYGLRHDYNMITWAGEVAPTTPQDRGITAFQHNQLLGPFANLRFSGWWA